MDVVDPKLAPGATPKNPEQPSAEDWQEKIDRLDAALKSQSASFARQIEKLKLKEPIEPKDAEQEPKTTREELAQLKASLKAEKDEFASSAKQSALEAAFKALGLSDEDAQVRADSFLFRNGSNLIYDEKKRQVIFKGDALTEALPLSEWFKAEDAAGRFKALKPGVRTVTKTASGSGPNPTPEPPELTKAALMSGGVTREQLRAAATKTD